MSLDLLPFKVNWSSPLETFLEYRTEIFESRNYTESRRAARSEPRERLSFRALTTGFAAQNARAVMQTKTTGDYIFADPRTKALTTAPAQQSDSSIEMADAPAWATQGYYIVLEIEGTESFFQVTASSAGTYDVTPPLPVDVPQGTVVRRGFVCRIQEQVDVQHALSGVMSAPITLLGRVGQNYLPQEAAPSVMYKDLPVFTKKPNWGRAVSRQFSRRADISDFSFGRIFYEDFLDFVPQVNRATFLNRNRAFAVDSVAFFALNKGRRGEFYAPSWTEDLPLNSQLVSGLSRVPCRGIDVARYGSSPVHKHIYVYLKSGELLFREVTGFTVVGDNTEVFVDAPWDQNYALEEISHIGWLNLQRFATDEIQLTWPTTEVSETTLSFQLLRPPEE